MFLADDEPALSPLTYPWRKGWVLAGWESVFALYPPKDNKGGQTYMEGAQRPTQGPTLDGGPWAWPELGVAARAASSAARAVAAAILSEHVSLGNKVFLFAIYYL